MAITSVFQTEYERSIRFTGSISVCGKTWLIRVTWDDEIARSNRVTPTKTDIKKVQRKKRRNAMLSNSIKLEQVNTEIRCDSLMAFWYTAEGPSYIKS